MSLPVLVVVVLALAGLCVLPAGAAEKPRLVVLTDIGGDPDDQQSMIRLITYANEFDIEGLIASASGVPGRLPGADGLVRPPAGRSEPPDRSGDRRQSRTRENNHA